MKRVFENNKYYHIYNRGVDKRVVFKSKIDYFHFFELMINVNQEESIGSIYKIKQNDGKNTKVKTENLVEIISYSLLPNHYHLLLKQVKDNGISKFMHKVGTGHTNHFNMKEKRSGSLFQGPFKSIYVDNEDYLDYLSAYINGNSEIHGISKAVDYAYSGYKYFLEGKKVFSYDKLFSSFNDVEEYKKYVSDVIKNARNIKEDKKMYNLE
jgi:putative transposase